jgi:mRNA interferase RelE/StbE
MKVTFQKSFTRDLKKIKDQELRDEVRSVIERVEAAEGPRAISELKKLEGFSRCYRIRVGDYRIGLMIDGGTVIFVRFLPRRDLYRFFP